MRKIVVILGIVLASCSGTGESKQGDPAVTTALRVAALTTPLPFTGSPNEPLVVLVDMNFGFVVSTVLATKEGDASLYTTKGGGVIGGGGIPHIHAAALKLIQESAKHVQAMTTATTFPLPSSGKVRFYVRTPHQVYTAEASLPGLIAGTDPLTPLFGAAMDLGTPLQDLDKKK